jgi:type II secretory pathway pseudopilin PulG
MEVLVALAIFLISLIALGQLLTISGERAFEVQQQSHAAQLCQSKLAEVVSGVVPLSTTSQSYDEDPDWQWKLDAEQDSAITGLWRVQVTASRDLPDGSHYESSVSQMVLDPSLRGSTADALQSPIVGNNPTTGTGYGSSGSGGGPGATGMRSGSGAQGGMAGGGGGVAPAPRASTPSTTTPRSTTPSTTPPRASAPK